ncbi:GRAS family protein RAD1-like [Salvia splendens]|uniref:GRAS family protein RAD1-like n=1 Tax=Salvia splendens TaxID=180675 RepID=UPI001C2618B3|nr:GRAS family protein RAD1-like [Salvia splendens]
MQLCYATIRETMENMRQDSAIRQFCAARAEEQELDHDLDHTWPSLDFTNDNENDAPQPEVDQLVNTFFNDNDDNNNNNEEDSITDDVYSRANVNQATDHDERGADEGLQLVHLLLTCAEAVGCRDAHLAHSILNQISPRLNPWGDSLQRVSHCFAIALKSRLLLLQHISPNGSFSTNNNRINASTVTKQERAQAFALLHKTTPYIAFGFAAANAAICQAANGKPSLHIVDLGMQHNLQWPSLLKSLSIQPSPPKIVRITGVITDPDAVAEELEHSMKRLCEYGIDLECNFVREVVSPLTLTREKLGLKEEEVLVVNSIMQLHKHVKESRGSLKTILQSIKKLGPDLVTVVEQDANHNGPFFLGRFLECLHYYAAVFDSLEWRLARGSGERMKIERWHMGEEICNVVACEGEDRVERHERAEQWRRQMGRAGFQVVGLECLDEVKGVVGGYGSEGYTLTVEKGCLQLGWKGRPIMMASAWQLNNLSSSAS